MARAAHHGRASGQGRILVAGGAGFLGSHLCERLLQAGERVLCVDNFQTGRLENLASLLDHPRFALRRHDVAQPLSAGAAPLAQIYNLACPASPLHYQRDPVQTTRTNVLGALNLLALAHGQAARILQASTSEVYGDPDEHPQPETYWGRVNPIGPRACYDEGKRCAETLFFGYHRQHALEIKVVRIFNTYGPRMHPGDGRVVSNFIVQALRGEDLTIYGNGQQTRSFCYVTDLVDGLLRMMASAAAVTGPINLGNPIEIPIQALAERVLSLVGGKSRLVFRPLPVDDPRQRRPDIRRAQAQLAWQPRVDLDAGLKETVAYFRRLLAGGEAGLAPLRSRSPLRSRASP